MQVLHRMERCVPRSRSSSPACWRRSPPAAASRTTRPRAPVWKEQRAYLAALDEAPAEVKLAGETPISECLAENQQGGDLATVGEAMVETATELNGEAPAVPSSPAALQLGYLLGAAQRGADRTEGIHSDLIRRLTVAARYSKRGRSPPASSSPTARVRRRPRRRLRPRARGACAARWAGGSERSPARASDYAPPGWGQSRMRR